MPQLSLAELGEDQGPRLLPVFIVFTILPVIAVCLRVLARILMQVKLWWDDYLIFVALVHVLLAIFDSLELRMLTLLRGLRHRSTGFPRGR